MEDAKELLATMTGLSGVVIGYYFGRVPGESRASQAQQQMATAVADTERANRRMSVSTRSSSGLRVASRLACSLGGMTSRIFAA
jgi:hypothetical protein